MSTVVMLGLAFGAGLVVGWNVLPQPRWVRRIYVKASEEIEDRLD
jgi:hypothetical protein